MPAKRSRHHQMRRRVQAWQITLLLAIVATLATALVITLHSLPASAQTQGYSLPATSHPNTQPGNDGPASLGIHYGAPTTLPKVLQNQAIQAARAWIGSALASQATQITAQYVLFSNDEYYSTDAQGQKHYFFQNVPAWVVSFEGLMLARHGRTVRYNHEENVVINAMTGEYMEAFSYR
jgi:hypothetical protein